MRVVERTSCILTAEEADQIISGKSIEECQTSDRKKSELRTAGLSEFEVYNLLNARPKTLAVLQTIIEEMTDRFTAKQLEEILIIIQAN